MRNLSRWILLLTALLPGLARADGGDEVAVVYNTQMPGSKLVADHYAVMRQVPTNQIFGLALPTTEEISRADFAAQLQQPLADQLAASGLWKFGEVNIVETNRASHVIKTNVETRVVASKIRYLVLCYGVPLKIAPDSVLDKIENKIAPSQFARNEAAVDSELAWLPLVKTPVSLTGPLVNPFYGCTNRAALNPTNGILMVARLDGPNADIANSLVDKSLEAERNGLWGRAYFDARGLSKGNTAYYLGDEWMLAGADICRQAGFDVDVDTNAATYPVWYPMSQIAIYAGWYEGNVCGPFALPKVEFMPGAFAYHLYSYSAGTLRSATSLWCGPLLAKGATCTMGCVYEPYLQFTPNIALFLEHFVNGDTFGEAAWVSQNALSWQTTVIGDPLYRPFGKPLAELHAQLARTHSPLLQWSFERIANLDLVHGLRAPAVAQFLEFLPLTAKSAVLSEKLADLYDTLGKPDSAIDDWQRALKLNPSPEQRIRIRRILGPKLLAQGHKKDALKDYKALLQEAPDYPGKADIEEKIKDMK